VQKDTRSCYLRVRGHRTHYLEAGEGPPLLLIHGGGLGASGQHGFGRCIPLLARHFRVYAIDLLGNGLSDAPDIDYSVQQDVWHLAAFLEALCLEKVNLCGNSRGAEVAAKFALDHPERVARLLMVASASVARDMGIEIPMSEGRQALRRMHQDLSAESMRAFLRTLIHDPTRISEELVAGRVRIASRPGVLEANRRSIAAVAAQAADPNLAQRADLRHRLPRLSIPLGLVWGREDRFAPLELGYQLKERLPNLREFHVLEDCGHQVQTEQPERFAEIALSFFRED
jgi:pimeloyl-ACP methyl ester carboxylesterase